LGRRTPSLEDNNGATGKIIINFYDGTRQLVAPETRVLLTVTDGNKRTVFRDFVQGTTVTMDVPFFNNFGDQYTRARLYSCRKKTNQSLILPPGNSCNSIPLDSSSFSPKVPVISVRHSNVMKISWKTSPRA